MAKSASKTANAKSGKRKRAPPLLEWIASATGVVMAAAVISMLIWDIARDDGRPPVIAAEAGRVTASAVGFTVEIKVSNRSPATAARVEIEGTLRRDAMPVETSRVVMDYIPGHSTRRGGLFFTSDPRQSQLTLRPLGYAQP